jgi:hypothetical protein
MKNNRIFSRFVASQALNNAALAQTPMPSFVSARAVATRGGDRVTRVPAGTRPCVPSDKVFTVS